ncbi:MAG TPA: response regulator [Verrucomicrobiae bacterium]|nr:response regulator [Verrucomicrobiae bacterium]
MKKKKILIIEDNQVVANVYGNLLTQAGYAVEITLDGEGGLERLEAFQPDLLLLDLMLPRMSGVEVIKHVRGQTAFARLPVLVFSNAHLTEWVQDAWKAGANKCLSKITCPPREVVGVVRQMLGEGRAVAHPAPAEGRQEFAVTFGSASPADGSLELAEEFEESLESTFAALRTGLQHLAKTSDEADQLKQIFELYRSLHNLTDHAGVAGLRRLARMAEALEALFKELYEKPGSINPSTLRTAAAGVDLLGLLLEHGRAGDPDVLSAHILVVDDEPVSRRAINYAIEKARLQAVNAPDATSALQLLTERDFDLIFLDVDLPDLNGYELCAKLRAIPQYKKTPVVFVTVLDDLDTRAHSLMAGGNDFIAKPFLFIELTVKTLIHVFRAKWLPRT